ncbi:MAG: D-alanyl-D-alanine carboxypeptidase family protein [Candidatus Sumerlaeota bacterium]
MSAISRSIMRVFSGLMALALTCLPAAKETEAPEQWAVLPGEIALRSAATTDSAVIATATQDSKLTQAGEGDVKWVHVEYQGNKGYVPEALVLRVVKPETDEAGNLPVGKEVVDRDTPLPLDYKPSDLVAIDKQWDYHTGGVKHLRKEPAEAMERMFQAARGDKVHLRVVSSFRSAMQQRYLYLRKIKKSGIAQQLVAKPGHSEHQLGTTIDVSGLNPETVLKADFAETREGKWLRKNAEKFGFRFTYTEATQAKTGFKPEPWHIRYMGKPKEEPQSALPSR